MNYFLLQYHYPKAHVSHISGPGFHINMGDPCEDDNAVKANSKAERIARGAERALELHTAHEYAWPDGSLYRAVLTERTKAELIADFKIQLPDGYRVTITEGVPKCKYCDLDIDAKDPYHLKKNVVVSAVNREIRCINNPGHLRIFEVPEFQRR